MLKEEWTELNEMHAKIGDNGLTSFSSDFLERYSELFAKSLQGKGDPAPSDGPNNSLV
jgi:hypothetical protein